MTIRVLVADDHPVARFGICNELGRNSDIEVIGQAVDGLDALRLTEALQPCVLLLDAPMSGIETIRVVRTARAQPAPPRVLILTDCGDWDDVREMLEAGAAGCLLKDEGLSLMVEGIRAVAGGRMWLSAGVAQNLAYHPVDPSRRRPASDASRLLSERETEVLRFIAKGCSNAHIAETLAISEGTVRNHVMNIYDKLQVRTRAEAVAWAWERGYVDRGKSNGDRRRPLFAGDREYHDESNGTVRQ